MTISSASRCLIGLTICFFLASCQVQKVEALVCPVNPNKNEAYSFTVRVVLEEFETLAEEDLIIKRYPDDEYWAYDITSKKDASEKISTIVKVRKKGREWKMVKYPQPKSILCPINPTVDEALAFAKKLYGDVDEKTTIEIMHDEEYWGFDFDDNDLAPGGGCVIYVKKKGQGWRKVSKD